MSTQTIEGAVRWRRRWWVWALGILLVILVIPVGGYALLMARFAAGRPVLSHNYAAEINAPVHEIPLRDRAWPEYRRILLVLRDADPEFLKMDSLPGWRDWESAKGFLVAHSQELAEVRHAAGRPYLGYLLFDEDDWALSTSRSPRQLREADNPTLISLSIEVFEMRHLQRLLLMDALLAAEKGDDAAATADLIAAVQMGCQLWDQRTFLVHQLVALSQFNLAVDALCSILLGHPDFFSRLQYQELAQAFDKMLRQRDRCDLAGELLIFDDYLQRYFTDNGNGDGSLTIEGAREMESMPFPPERWSRNLPERVYLTWLCMATARRQELSTVHRAVLAERQQARAMPMWQWEALESEEEIVARIAGQHSESRYQFLLMFIGGLSRLGTDCERTIMLREAALAILALHAFRLEHGRWPAALEELVPRHLPELPIDRFNGQPLCYRLVDGEPRLYSVARNQRDDGGLAMPLNDLPWEFVPQIEVTSQMAASGGTRPITGDWVFWPPQLREEPPPGKSTDELTEEQLREMQQPVPVDQEPSPGDE